MILSAVSAHAEESAVTNSGVLTYGEDGESVEWWNMCWRKVQTFLTAAIFCIHEVG